MEIRDILALNLKRLRAEQGLSQEELADRADIDRTYVSSLERSVYAVGVDVLDRLAKACRQRKAFSAWSRKSTR